MPGMLMLLLLLLLLLLLWLAHGYSAADDEPSPRPTSSPTNFPTPAASQKKAPAPSQLLSSSLTPHQRLQAFAYNPPAQQLRQPIEYRPSARASGLKKTTAATSNAGK